MGEIRHKEVLVKSIFEEFCTRVHTIQDNASLPMYVCAMNKNMVEPLLKRLNNKYFVETNELADFEWSEEDEHIVCFSPVEITEADWWK